MKNFFFTGKPTAIPLILNKNRSLKESWESKLHHPGIGFVADLGEQEVWSIILREEEGLATEHLQTLSKNQSLVPTMDF